MAVYVEALDDLSPDELDRSCREATRDAMQFPKPGHVREALKKMRSLDSQFLGPRLLKYDEPPLSEEEKTTALKFSDELRKKIGAVEPSAARKKIVTRPSTKSIDEQKAELKRKGFL